jgi:hypothetical protein
MSKRSKHSKKNVNTIEFPNFWVDKDIYSYIREGRINELPDYPGDADTDQLNLPDFFYDVIYEPEATTESCYRFVRKFFLYYYFSDKFKDLVKFYNILLIKDQYAGVFATEDDAVKYANSMGIMGKDIFIIPITPIVERC